jgi:hypothetical protein
VCSRQYICPSYSDQISLPLWPGRSGRKSRHDSKVRELVYTSSAELWGDTCSEVAILVMERSPVVQQNVGVTPESWRAPPIAGDPPETGHQSRLIPIRRLPGCLLNCTATCSRATKFSTESYDLPSPNSSRRVYYEARVLTRAIC